MLRSLTVSEIGDSPMTLAQGKQHLRIYHNEDDADIADLIREAYGVAESRTGRMVRTYSGILQLSGFPSAGSAIVLPRPPLTAVTEIQYYDRAGNSQTITTAQVHAGLIPGQISLPIGLRVWPDTAERMDAVTVTFTGGGSEPEPIRAAVRLLLDLSYNNLDPAKAEQVNKRIDGMLHGFTIRDPRLYGITL